MSDAIVLDVADTTPVRLDVGDADPIAREEIAELATRVTTVEGDVTALDERLDTAEGNISTLGTTVDGIDERVEAIEADYVTAEDVMGALGGEFPALAAGSSRAMLGDPETASWMERTTAADGAALIEAVYGNTVVDSGSLLPVRMEGVETVGFNQWDEQWINGNINEDGTPTTYAGGPVRSKNYIPVFPSTAYYCRQFAASNQTMYSVYCYDANKDYIGVLGYSADGTFTSLAGTHYIMFRMYSAYGTTYKHDICINLSDPSRNGTYEPYWSSQLAIPAATYFPQGLRSAGSVYDELTETQAITRVGAVDLGTLTWSQNTQGQFFTNLPTQGQPYATNHICVPYETSAHGAYDGNVDKSITITGTRAWIRDSAYTNAAAFKSAMSGVMLHYALATPTTTPIDPPLPMSYRTGAGGTERVMVASGTTSAPPIFVTRYPLDPTDLAASIAPRESVTAEANHAVGDLIMLGWTLCKVTTAIARGEAITIGTNVTKTSVAAEIAALS